MTRSDALDDSELVCRAIGRFYGHLLADPEVSSFFEGIDMVRLQRHQQALITALAGGPDTYTGRGLGEAHAGLGITDTDFDAFLAHFVDTMIEIGAPDELIGRVGSLIAPLRAKIVGTRKQSEPPAFSPRRADTPA